MHARRATLVTVVASITAMTIAATASANPAAPFTNDAVDRVVVSGTPVASELINDLAVAYNEAAGCLMAAADFPLTPTSPTQNRCLPPAEQVGTILTENYDHDVVTPFYPQEKAGLRQLCAQRTTPPRDPRVPAVDLVQLTSRPPIGGAPQLSRDGYRCSVAGGTQAGVVLRFVAIARDAQTFLRWPGGAPITSLRQYELFDIFVSCQLTHWNQVGTTYNGEPFYPPPSGPAIQVFAATPQSEERAMWDAFVGGPSDGCIPLPFKDGDPTDGERIVAANDVRAVEAALSDPAAANEGNSIFYMSAARHTAGPQALRGASVLGAVDVSSTAVLQPVLPTAENVESGLFPFTRFVYLAFRNSGPSPVASGATRRFAGTSASTNDQAIGWLCKPDGGHSEPIGSPGPGIESGFADRDYGTLVAQVIGANGFVPIEPDPDTGRTCLFTDVAVT